MDNKERDMFKSLLLVLKLWLDLGLEQILFAQRCDCALKSHFQYLPIYATWFSPQTHCYRRLLASSQFIQSKEKSEHDRIFFLPLLSEGKEILDPYYTSQTSTKLYDIKFTFLKTKKRENSIFEWELSAAFSHSMFKDGLIVNCCPV